MQPSSQVTTWEGPRAPAPSDLGWLNTASQRSDVPPRWNPWSRTPTPEWLTARLWNGVYTQYVLEHATSADKSRALFQVYDLDLANRTAHLCLVSEIANSPSPDHIQRLIERVFTDIDVHVLILPVSSVQALQLHQVLEQLFTLCGVLSAFEHVGDTWLDVQLHVTKRPC